MPPHTSPALRRGLFIDRMMGEMVAWGWTSLIDSGMPWKVRLGPAPAKCFLCKLLL